MQKNILEYMERTVKKVPGKTAYADEETTLTFRQLYEGARAIGSALAKRGFGREPVLIFMDKSPYAVQAFFGAVYAGCFYVPLDGEMPPMRMELILENTGARVMVCDGNNLEKAEKLHFSGEILLADDLRKAETDHTLLERIRGASIDTDPLYVLFTSGSTGMPKGVVGHHRGVIDYLDQLADVLGLSEETVFGNQTPLYFDASMKDIFSTIKLGATTWLIPKHLFSFPLRLVEYLNSHRINTVCWVVSALTMISSFGTFEELVPETLHTVAFGSEVFPVKQFNLWKRALPRARFVNLYGPTEATGVCCYYEVKREFSENDVIPVGHPFPNARIYLLKEDGSRAEAGGEGEICICGTCLTHGYYNQPERTRGVFVQNPLNTGYAERMYKTGDIGKINENGELVFLSRKDYQIKHMGHRIELGEIDANVSAVEGVRQACCIFSRTDGKLVLFYTGRLDKAALMGALKTKLPRYMLPNKVILMERLPLTATGKLDRRGMEALYEERAYRGRKEEQ